MTLEMLAQEEVAMAEERKGIVELVKSGIGSRIKGTAEAVNAAARLVPIVPEVGKPYYKAETALLASALSQLSVRRHYPLGVGEKEYNTQRRGGL